MRLTQSLPTDVLAAYVGRQAYAAFPDQDETGNLRAALPDTLERLRRCFSHVRLKGYWAAEGPHFNHLYTDQYAVFLYYLSNTAHRMGLNSLAAKAYALNKALHAFDAFYEVDLPEVFAVVHPVGTVLGRGTYSDYLLVYQNVSVGADPFRPGHPRLGEGVVLYGGCRVIGNVSIGDNCLVSAGAAIMAGETPDNHLVFGVHPANVLKPHRHDVRRDIFHDQSSLNRDGT